MDSFRAFDMTLLELNRYIAEGLGESVINNAISGSFITNIRDRITANSALKPNPLLIWDGFANLEHIDGSLSVELDSLAAIVAFKRPFQNWLYIPPIAPPPVATRPPISDQFARDMLALRDQAMAIYGAMHVFDSLPTLRGLSDRGALDEKDISDGFPPRSVYIDGLHLTERALRAVAAALTASGGPMAVARAL